MPPKRSAADAVLEGTIAELAAGHPSWRAVRWGAKDERYTISHVVGKKRISMQTTVKACGSQLAAARIARLCHAKILEGATRASAMALRAELCERLASARKGDKAKTPAGKHGPNKKPGAVSTPVAKQGTKRKKTEETPKPKAAAKKADEKGPSRKRPKAAEPEDEGEDADPQQCMTLCTVMETAPLRQVGHTTAARYLVDGTLLNDNVIMPVVGFGTYKLKKGDAFAPVLKAFQVGYRLIDTAQIYGNEGDVGQALLRSGIPRDRVFLETKVWRSSHGYERTLKAAKASLRLLKSDYIDLYIIHWPGCKTGWPLPRGTKSPPDWTPKMRDEGTWRAMEQLHDEGKVRSIGVSNYSIRHLKNLLKVCRVRPTVNQVEFHPWLVQSDLLEFCKKEGIVLQAYASLGSGDVSCRADFFALKPVLAAAKTHDRTSAQVLLRWAMEKGIHVIPKSKSQDRQIENFGVFDFKLTSEEVAAIDACHINKRFAWKKLDPDTIE